MSSKQEKETVEEQRTREYRQVASYLSSVATLKTHDCLKQRSASDSSNDAMNVSLSSSSLSSSLHALPSVRVAQHLLTNHPGWIPLQLLNHRNDDNNDSVTLSSEKVTPVRTRKQIVLPCCPHCGAPLQPGFQNTTVRLQSTTSGARSRSQRRRLSRRVARIHQAKKKQAKQSNTTPQISRLGYFVKEYFGDDSTSSSSSVLNHKLERINCRNVLQIRCGTCNGHTQLPGFPRPRVTKKPKETPTKAVAASTPQSGINPTADFITFSNRTAAMGKTKKKREQEVTMISSVGSSKKRKADSKNKNKLMNFLSSLNEH